MSAIADYSALKTQVAAFVNRTDLTAQMPVFIGMAESMVRRDVRVRAMEAVITGTMTGETLAQPSDLIESRRFTVADKVLNYVTPERYNLLDQRTVTGGNYTVIGSDFYVLGANSGDDYRLVYWAQFEPFSADADSNWLLENAPEVYLWSGCHQASIFLKDVAAAQNYLAMYQLAVTALNEGEKSAQTTGGPMVIRSDRQE